MVFKWCLLFFAAALKHGSSRGLKSGVLYLCVVTGAQDANGSKNNNNVRRIIPSSSRVIFTYGVEERVGECISDRGNRFGSVLKPRCRT